ncbi:MAG: putative motility protein [Roseburia lenta]|nr:putative motility protein [Roseburia lenta]
MNITPVSSGMISDTGALQQIGIAMLSKQLDTATSTGDLLAASLSSMPAPVSEASINGIGQNIDLRV